jgi:hypothetical protein
MVDDRVAEDQLSQCPLTFRDLSIIKETFINILVGVYHGRIEYPEDKKEKDSGKQDNPDQENTEAKEEQQTQS